MGLSPDFRSKASRANLNVSISQRLSSASDQLGSWPSFSKSSKFGQDLAPARIGYLAYFLRPFLQAWAFEPGEGTDQAQNVWKSFEVWKIDVGKHARSGNSQIGKVVESGN